MNEHGQVQRFIVVERDISERIEIEKNYQMRSKNQPEQPKQNPNFWPT